ncbi:uncharacterized protein LOC132605873 isoform X1 [Lycium barbarum]|uniref:uncharacterized protein LOC132605873 isoform X1 n=1 Tax=Lycium barbarum TaxID=112863 RepID=UPI00293E3753|nr:uncharacterized protein LOC132605873 isoform X1 [Lycium barbarum]
MRSSNERRTPVAVNGGGGCYSYESEPDLAAMVSDFMESSSTSSAESRYSSDNNDSGYSDLSLLADRISYLESFTHLLDAFLMQQLTSTKKISAKWHSHRCKQNYYPVPNSWLYKNSVDQYESDLTMVVHSLILSMTDSCHIGKPETCNASCVRSYLVKLLQSCGYNADMRATKWQGCGRIPGGEHEYIEVISHGNNGCSERYIIDIDFRSHFEIARAVKSYDVVLNCLPAVYVGTITKLKLYLQAMVEAAKCSLKQNSMPLPPWRSLAYLEAKWESSSQKVVNIQVQSSVSPSNSSHRHCTELLWRIKSCIGSEIKPKGFLVPMNCRKRQGLKIGLSHSSPVTP